MPATLIQVSLIVDDPGEAVAFYRELFDAPEEHTVNPEGYRGVILGNTIIGFNEPAVRPKLGLSGSDSKAERPEDDSSYFTVFVESEDAVDATVAKAIRLGATIIAGPLRTPFNWYLTALRDPQGIALRIATSSEPAPRARDH